MSSMLSSALRSIYCARCQRSATAAELPVHNAATFTGMPTLAAWETNDWRSRCGEMSTPQRFATAAHERFGRIGLFRSPCGSM